MKSFFRNKLTTILIILFFLSSCGGGSYFPDTKKQPVNADERVEANIKEGRGLKLGNFTNKGGDFMFASSNPLWRATLDSLNFMPLLNVDYAGGMIITDWYGDIENNEDLKVAVRFLTNEIRSDALNITVYKRNCKETNSCQISKIDGTINDEIKNSILKRAAILKKENESKEKDD
jgi:predicted small lipoprotein YifL